MLSHLLQIPEPKKKCERKTEQRREHLSKNPSFLNPPKVKAPFFLSQKRENLIKKIGLTFSCMSKQRLGEMMQTIEQAPPPPAQSASSQQLQLTAGSMSFNSNLSKEDEEMSRSALSTFRAKEEEIERKKLEVREKVQAQLGRVEEETKRLATIREELEGLSDPMRKEVSLVRKKIDSVNKELKPLGQSCQKKEREYKEALEAFNEKNREKVQLITKLMESMQLVGESEKMRMKKLEELSKNIDSMQL